MWTKEQKQAYRKQWYSKNKQKVLSKNRLNKYGVTEERYNDLLNFQKDVCAICKEECNVRDSLCVDHNHKTNEVRGLLCHHCNTSLGGFKDNKKFLMNAIKYLEYYERE